MSDVSSQKALLRQKILDELACLPKAYFFQAGLIVKNHLQDWLSSLNEKPLSICLFENLPKEINTKYIFEHLKEICANVTMLTIKSPLNFSMENYHIVFLPGLGFDKNGSRLGRGKGFFDKALANAKDNRKYPILIGLTTDIQVKDCIPTEPHDVKMDFICTPKLGLIKTSEKKL